MRNNNIDQMVSDILSEWMSEQGKNAMGIPYSDYFYHKLKGNQVRLEEREKTQVFVDEMLNFLNLSDCTCEFINYGDTELVYVIKKDDKPINTLLVGQPSVFMGTVKREHDNLKSLAQRYPDVVVAPVNYYRNDEREAYQTPYFNQARCIATQDDGYGVYIPEPFYRFETFTKDDEYLINKVMIANLVRLYDADNSLGLAACKIGGGDFILEKAYDIVPHTETTTLENMHLIAAREFISVDLDNYLKLIRDEFMKSTYYQDEALRDPSVFINYKNRCPMKRDAIEDGISLGLKLRK